MQTEQKQNKTKTKGCNRQCAAASPTHLLQLCSRAAAAACCLAFVQISERAVKYKPEIGAVDVLCFEVSWNLCRMLQKHTE